MKVSKRYLICGIVCALFPWSLSAAVEPVTVSAGSEVLAGDPLADSRLDDLEMSFGTHKEHVESIRENLRAKIEEAEMEQSLRLPGIPQFFIVVAWN